MAARHLRRSAALALAVLSGCASSPSVTSANQMEGSVEKASEIELPGGGKIYGALTLPRAAAGEKFPLVIMSHGFNGSADDLGAYASALAERGVASYRFDFRGSREGTRSQGLSMREMTIPTEEDDLLAVISAAEKMEAIEAGNIFLFGASMGGLVSALVAARPETAGKVKGLALLFPALCIERDWTAMFPDDSAVPDVIEGWGLGKVFATSARTLRTFDTIGKFTGPVLIMHGTRDEVAKMEDSERAASIYGRARLEKFEGEGHGFSSAADARAGRMLADFVASLLISP